MNINNIPILLNSFIKRKPFLDVCLFFIKKHLPSSTVYLTLDSENYNIYWENLNILTYDNIVSTSNEMHECHSRYFRHYYTLNYLKSLNHKYVMNYMDDGWLENINFEIYNNIPNYLEKFNADRIDLCGPQPNYNLISLENEIYYIDPNNDSPWYLTNQCSIWKINSLLKIYNSLGAVSDCDVEKYGSQYCREFNFKFLTFKSFILNNDGVFQRNVGLNSRGKKLLEIYCKENSLNIENELSNFIIIK